VFRQRNLQFALRKMFDENFSLSLFLEDIVFVVLFVEEAFGFFRLWFCRWFALLVFILISVVLYSHRNSSSFFTLLRFWANEERRKEDSGKSNTSKALMKFVVVGGFRVL